METLYIHKATGNLQPMTEATWEILGGEKSGWSVATEEEIEEQNSKVALEKPKPIMVNLPKANAKSTTIEVQPTEAKGTGSTEPTGQTQTPPPAEQKPAENKKPKVATAEEEA